MSVSAPGEWTSQLRRGVLELCILQVLHHQPSYGYEIVTTLESLGPLASGENTVYPLLRRLKTDRCLGPLPASHRRGRRGGHPITPEGRRRLGALTKEWDAMVDAVGQCMRKGETS